MKKSEQVNNILPFPIDSVSPKEGNDPHLGKEKVDILVCSNCEGTTFFLITDTTNRIACAECQCVVDAEWFCEPWNKTET